VCTTMAPYPSLLLLPLLLPATLASMSGASLKITTAPNRPFIHSAPGGFQGILVDMMEELSRRLGFTFTIAPAKDGKYGKEQGGQWSGMMGEVLRGEADMALADLTITATREAAVDFSHPFMYAGLGLLAHRGATFNSLQEVADDDTISIGSFCCGSTAAAFRNASLPLYQRIWAKMQQPGVMANSNDEGTDKVLAGGGKYVYIMESPQLQYKQARNCQLKRVGDLFLKRSYGIAVAPGSPYRELLSREILKMQESGAMEEITNKWLGLEGATCPTSNPWWQGLL